MRPPRCARLTKCLSCSTALVEIAAPAFARRLLHGHCPRERLSRERNRHCSPDERRSPRRNDSTSPAPGTRSRPRSNRASPHAGERTVARGLLHEPRPREPHSRARNQHPRLCWAARRRETHCRACLPGASSDHRAVRDQRNVCHAPPLSSGSRRMATDYEGCPVLAPVCPDCRRHGSAGRCGERAQRRPGGTRLVWRRFGDPAGRTRRRTMPWRGVPVATIEDRHSTTASADRRAPRAQSRADIMRLPWG
ncbi:hypothetical protein DFR70_116134 [Nocardia tenerifensis]|uniref:Uncharacterized protein n=1 Tax=Nocardia tenerifensis TaxID=228006 RepID=A0A318JSD1_9NOCA|nr:hypothetical protein DFR70_116134 [Nocardia tenerifensis]